MVRSWTILGSAVLLTLALAAPAARADNPEFKNDSDKLTEVLRRLHDLQDKVAELQAGQALQIKAMQDDINRLKEEVARLEQGMAQARISGSINPNPNPPLVTGTIRLENRYAAPATFVINGTSYRLMPSEVVTVTDQPVGRFTYKVFTDDFGLVQPPVDRFLSPTRTFPITVHP
jgi:hypothetical protein